MQTTLHKALGGDITVKNIKDWVMETTEVGLDFDTVAGSFVNIEHGIWLTWG